MTRVALVPLHIEWTPHSVRAVNVSTGETAVAPTIRELGSILGGHREVIAGIGRSSVFLKTLRLPNASADDLRRILEVQLGQHFPLPAEELSFDFIQTANQSVDGFLTMVAAIRAEDLRRIRQELSDAGLTSQRILPVALGSAALAAREHKPSALVVEGTASGLGLDVVDNGVVVYSRVAPAGALPIEEARRTLAAAQASNAQSIAVGLVDLAGAQSTTQSPLLVLDEAPQFTFTLTEDRRIEAGRRVTVRMRLAALMAVAAVLSVVTAWSVQQDSTASMKKSQGSWARWVATHKSIVNAETDKASKVIAVQDSLDRAFQPGQTLSDINWVVADSLPPGAWLTGLTVERGKPLQIRGTAKSGDDIAKFVDTLGADNRFRGVNLVFANSAAIGKVPVVQFNVSATCVGNLPMPTPVKAAARSVRTAETSATAGAGAGS